MGFKVSWYTFRKSLYCATLSYLSDERVLDPFESRLGVTETNNDKFRGRKTPEYGLMTVHMTIIT